MSHGFIELAAWLALVAFGSVMLTVDRKRHPGALYLGIFVLLFAFKMIAR